MNRRDRDPETMRAAIERFSAARGWAPNLAVAKLRGRWEEVVGPILAPRTEPLRLTSDGKLEIACDHGATANEVAMLADTITSRASDIAGQGLVSAVVPKVRRKR